VDITHRGSRENTTQVTLKTLENQGFQDLAVFADFSKNRHFLVSGPKSKRASGQRKYRLLNGEQFF
jgi:hypothetical protein